MGVVIGNMIEPFVNREFHMHYLLSYIFGSTAKAPAVNLLRLHTLRDTTTTFLPPERYDEPRETKR